MNFERMLLMENSKILLREAQKAIKETKKLNWSIGGGTVLAQRFNHRLSEELILFFAVFLIGGIVLCSLGVVK